MQPTGADCRGLGKSSSPKGPCAVTSWRAKASRFRTMSMVGKIAAQIAICEGADFTAGSKRHSRIALIVTSSRPDAKQEQQNSMI